MRFPGDAVLFDLDGTLVDTAEDLCGALNRALKSVGRPPVTVQQVRGMIGGGLPNLVMKGLEATGGPIPTAQYDEIVKNARADYEEHVADKSKPYPGVLESLRGLAQRGSKMGVCTNKPAGASKKLLAAHARRSLCHACPWTVNCSTAQITDRKSTRLNSSHSQQSRMPSSA